MLSKVPFARHQLQDEIVRPNRTGRDQHLEHRLFAVNVHSQWRAGGR